MRIVLVLSLAVIGSFVGVLITALQPVTSPWPLVGSSPQLRPATPAGQGGRPRGGAGGAAAPDYPRCRWAPARRRVTRSAR